jgi:hypothetical protein
MDWSMILGILGIVVSIGVGWLTYRLANRRASTQRYESAKATVLQELSKSLGEDSVPSVDVLEATIRSVLRETGDPRVHLLVDHVLDDLIRQVTSDPFLDSVRRRKLQDDIQLARSNAASTRMNTHPEPPAEFVHLASTFWSTVIALAATAVTMVVVTAPTFSTLKDAVGVLKHAGYSDVLLAGLIFLALGVCAAEAKPGGCDFFGRRFWQVEGCCAGVEL